MTDLADAVAHAVPLMAGKIVRQLSRTHRIDGHELRSTPSIGIAVFPSDGEDVGALMSGRHGDVSRQVARATKYQFFTAAMNAPPSACNWRMRCVGMESEFRLHFQPQIDIASGSVVAVEA
jgi:predicted signal transduction protein with EAL and GGDEF domain